jgi:hypothetical protein
MKYIILAMLLVGCAKSEGEVQQSDLFGIYERVGDCLYRYENKEVVCYTACSSGIQCKWKEGK